MLFFILSLAMDWGGTPRVLIASNLLPNVSPEMEKPEFWIKKIQNPGRLLLTPEEIQRMNEENLKKPNLILCRVKVLKEEWTRGEILTLLREDWESFGKTKEVRYGRNGTPLDESFWNRLRNNLNQTSLKERSRMLFGLVVKETPIRVFPTKELSVDSPTDDEFDRFQQSSISPGAPVGIYLFSKDNLWAYVQTRFIRGWVHLTDLAIAKRKSEVSDYEETKNRLIVTGNSANIFMDPSLKHLAFLVQMGTSFPVANVTSQGVTNNFNYTVEIPVRERNGGLAFRRAHIPANEDIHTDFLPYTQENIARQAFKMLHQPYSWGERAQGRDCSRFIMDLFATFGILMPRNSNLQAQVGISLGQSEGKTLEEKRGILDRAIPLATTLRLPGHIMLYLGKDHGNHYAIHSIWGIERYGRFGPVLEKIGKVMVSDLSLGKSGPHGSLLHRITDIRSIGVGKLNSP